MGQNGLAGLAEAAEIEAKHKAEGTWPTDVLATEDLSLRADGEIVKHTLKVAHELNGVLGEAAEVTLLVEEVTVGSRPIATFQGPKTLTFVAGDGQVCDALELAVASMKLGERCRIVCTKPRWCVEPELGLEDPEDFVSSESPSLEFTLELTGVKSGPDIESMHEDRLVEFAKERYDVASGLQKKGKFTMAVLRYRAMDQMLRSKVAGFDNDDNVKKTAAYIKSAEVNEQACRVYWQQEQAKPSRSKTSKTTAYVCMGQSCKDAASEVILTEIEELAAAAKLKCGAAPMTCIGKCTAAPTVLVVAVDKDGQKRQRTFERVDCTQTSAKVIEYATGTDPLPQAEPAMLESFSEKRIVQSALRIAHSGKLNKSLEALRQAEETASNGELMEVVETLAGVMERVGMYQEALDRNEWLIEMCPHFDGELNFRRISLLQHLGRKGDAVVALKECMERSTSNHDIEKAKKLLKQATAEMGPDEEPASKFPEGHQPWTVLAKVPVSRWSVMLTLRNKAPDQDVGVPEIAWQIWHRTLLAPIGENEEGPMPWVERDYTPVKDDGVTCDLLVKIYPSGKATQWIHKLEVGATVVLSKPMPTLMMPTCIPLDNINKASAPDKVILVVGGTGVTPAIQILKSFKDKDVPVSVFYACREDDALCLDLLSEAVQVPGARTRVALSLSSAVEAAAYPFHIDVAPPSSSMQDLVAAHPLLEFHRGRLAAELLRSALQEFGKEGLRVVISGPLSLNEAMHSFFTEEGVDRTQITVLQA
eukprot:TRINITY_DN81839_c0_g1_i1.p1 TRINITY_DN81839_c0_g1~~TRINITY_DN81839_c0_g1_i1.p1  ORF type:complete len:762 (+),score=197.23 TRINITY_DN81839_c0_g1_i1:135-2420(+)